MRANILSKAVAGSVRNSVCEGVSYGLPEHLGEPFRVGHGGRVHRGLPGVCRTPPFAAMLRSASQIGLLAASAPGKWPCVFRPVKIFSPNLAPSGVSRRRPRMSRVPSDSPPGAKSMALLRTRPRGSSHARRRSTRPGTSAPAAGFARP